MLETNQDNVETKKLLPIIKEFLQNALNEVRSEFYDSRIEEIEFKRRDGFIPFSHNKGGMDLIAYICPRTVIGSGIGSKENQLYSI